eukprot:jgi/Tetstr1/454028/TSEL_040947.t1
MKTRSGKTYFAEGEERCPVCMDSSWASVGGARLMCVEGCACPVPTTHAHCFLEMTATCDVRGDGRRMTRCPSCTAEVRERMASVMSKAQHNHDALRAQDPSYSAERSVMMHAVAVGARNMVRSAREYDQDTRDIARDMAAAHGYLVGAADAALRALDEGCAAKARARVSEMKSIVGSALWRNIGRMPPGDAARAEPPCHAC